MADGGRAQSIGPLRPGDPATRPVHEDPDLLARVAVRLTRDFAAWVRRRVETVTYVADTTVRRQISVDFVLPHADRADPDDPLAELDAQSAILVPLGLPEKAPLTHFDVWDETGAALSILNTRENGDLAERALRHLVREADPPAELLDPEGEAMQQIHRIATAKVQDAQRTFDEAAAGWLGDLFPEGDSDRILFEDLANSFMLLVPVRYIPGQHRVIKYAYDEPLDWAGFGATRASWISRLMVALGWQDKAQSLEHPIGLAEGYHVEIVAPDEVIISDAFMTAKQWSPPDTDHPDGYEKATSPASLASQRERAHLNVSTLVSWEDSEKARGDTGRSVFSLRARRSGTFRALLAATSLITVLILGTRLRLHHLDNTTAAAVLLIFPAVVAAYLARPGEHVFATRLLAGVRAIALLASICALFVAGMLGAELLQSRQSALQTTSCGSNLPRSKAARRAVTVQVRAPCKTARRQSLGPPASHVLVLDSLIWLSAFCAIVLWLAQLISWLIEVEGLVKVRRARLSQLYAGANTPPAEPPVPGAKA